MTRRRAPAALPAALLACAALGLGLSLQGCSGSSLSRGAEFYTHKRYIDAALVFEHTEPELSRYDVPDRARYGLYRGATLWVLGDLAQAQRWLRYGSELARRSLPPEEHGALLREVLRVARTPTLEAELAGPPLDATPRSAASGAAPPVPLRGLPAVPLRALRPAGDRGPAAR